MKYTKIAGLAFLAATTASSANASNFLQFGFDENEIYTDTADGENNNNVHPYIGFQVMPVEGSPLALSGSFNYLYFDSPAKRDDNNRKRTQLFVAYQWDQGDFTFAPKFGFRHHDYASGTHQTEWRFFPNMKYRLGETTDLYFDGLFMSKQGKLPDRAAGTTQDDLDEYADYKHELEVGVRQQLNSKSYLKLGVYNEYENLEDVTVDGDKESYSAWHARVYYGYQVTNKLFMEGFARIGLSKEFEYKGNYEDLDMNGQRVGINLNYDLMPAWQLRTMAFYETDTLRDHDSNGNGYKLDHSNTRWAYTVMLRHSF